MKKIILPLLVFATISSFSQEIKRENLSKKELEYLAMEIITLRSNPQAKKLRNSIKNNMVNFGFDIIYNEKIIYRGVIKKPSVGDIHSSMNRRKATFCLDYEQFDTLTKLELAENKKFKITKTKKGDKFLWTDDYELFKIDGLNGIVINDMISKKINIKFYKF